MAVPRIPTTLRLITKYGSLWPITSDDYEAYTAFWKSKKFPDAPASKNGRT